MRSRRFLPVLLAVASAWALTVAPATADQRVIVKTRKPYDAVRERVRQLGGTVAYEFKHGDGLVVTIPDGKTDALGTSVGVDYVVTDKFVPAPRPTRVQHAAAGEFTLSGDTVATPDNYFPLSLLLTNAADLYNDGFRGAGVVVAIIDSGVSATASTVGSRVIGGENFVPGASEPGATAATNDSHGTWVATTIGGSGAFLTSATGATAVAIRDNCLQPLCSQPYGPNPAFDLLPIVGQAPTVQFYALKVFPAAGGGAPESRILQAMDRAIELRKTTMPELRVVNMSLGGPTLFAGGDLEDELATSMAAEGITLVVSAGNEGPSGITGGSPGTARNIITVGATSDPIHERIVAQRFFGVAPGRLYRPDDHQQIPDFSSRGPTADGRIDPDVVANGTWTLAQGANGGLSWVSGTSFAAPVVSGIAAALYSYKPTATPSEIRRAILASADPTVVPTARSNDQGYGYVNAGGARALLDGRIPRLPADRGPGRRSVEENLEHGADVHVISHPRFATRLRNLRPAERREFFVEIDRHTRQLVVKVRNIAPSLPVDQQNVLFGDDLQVAVQSAKTSTADYLTEVAPGVPGAAFVKTDTEYVFDRLETGIMRVTVIGDWTNVGTVSTDVSIEKVHGRTPRHDVKGDISQGEQKVYTFNVPAGATEASFRLAWDKDWGAYPTNDIDMILVDPNGAPEFAGATLNSPESAVIANPVPGQWTVVIDGFTVFGRRDKFELFVDYDRP